MWAMWASGQPTGEGEEVDLLSFMGLNERRRHRQDRHVIGEIFIFFIYIHGIQYIYKMFLLKIMGIQLNTLELRWARACVQGVVSSAAGRSKCILAWFS